MPWKEVEIKPPVSICNPKPGESKEGEVLDILPREYKNGKGTVKRQYIRLRERGTEKVWWVPYHRLIREAFQQEKIQSGDRVKITYTGRQLNSRMREWKVAVWRDAPVASVAASAAPVEPAGKAR